MQINGNFVAGQQRGFPSQNQNKGFNLLSKSKARRHNLAISSECEQSLLSYVISWFCQASQWIYPLKTSHMS